MKHEYIVYIDESGDEGFKFQDGEKGSSRWFVLSAVVVRKANDLELVKLLKAARKTLNKPDKYVLHFRELRHEQRVPYAELIGSVLIKTVNVLVHKPSIKNPENFQQEPHKLYRYLTRLLLERVSWVCRDHAKDNGCLADLIFSNRSAMSYEELKDYLNRLHQASNNSSEVNIDWTAIRSERVRAVNHEQMAGLQVADAVATSVFYAANKSQYGHTEARYLEIIQKTLYRNKGRVDGYGLKIWCDDTDEIKRLTRIVSQ